MAKLAPVLTVLSFLAMAAVSPAHSQVKSKKKVKKIKKSWTLSSSITLATDLQKTSNNDKSVASELGAAVTWKLINGFRLTKSLSLSKEFTNNREQALGDGKLTLSRQIYKVNNNTSISGAVSFTLPYSKASREENHLYTSLSGNISLTGKLAAIKLKSTSAYVILGHRENFNKFTQDINGKFNTRRVTTQTAGISHVFNKFISGDFYFTNVMSSDYKGKSNLNSYVLAQAINITLPRSVSLVVGHQLGGSTFNKYTQNNLDIKVFDSDASQVFMALSHTY